MKNINLHNELYNKAMDELRVKYYRDDNAIAIPRDDLNRTYFKMIVEECAKSVEHIKVWDSNLGDHIKRQMGIL
jgi:hypothetical protein